MVFAIDNTAITHGIQLAVAPVFLLTAVAGMIGAVAGRLARIIDRARLVEGRSLDATDSAVLQRAAQELQQLRLRGQLANGCIALLTCCALLIGLTIIVLFLRETAAMQISGYAVASFLLGVLCFMAALLCFLAETFLATRLLDFQVARRH
ncbi:MAG: hypothetical protein JWP65_1119 [Ramlibacter sp.]|jgi:hypothetical protein|uniref:DUF2721 domain-containing protein n=1 Tax=Ramlibacter sp. TaxID=1917967 RepID=UPI00262B0D5E|nr:DUF2721 domain-containing protein [Ramlibacter sp.]MDB5750698.1 hypothetical protein [Ramlibacter sp.]